MYRGLKKTYEFGMHGTLYPRPYTVHHYLTEAIKTMGKTSKLDDVKNKEEKITEATQEYCHKNKRSLLDFFGENLIDWYLEWSRMWLGCFSAITKPLKQLTCSACGNGDSPTAPQHLAFRYFSCCCRWLSCVVLSLLFLI